MFYLILIAELVFSFIIGAVIIKMLLYITYRGKLFDVPDGRKVHEIPVPRLGGMSFMPALMIEIAVGIGAVYHTGLLSSAGPGVDMIIRLSYMLAAAMLLYVVGIMDDLVGLTYKVKLIAQFVASGMLVGSGLWLNNLYGLFGVYEMSAAVGIPVTMLLFVLITNALNMIDGIDGLASGIAIISLALLAFIYIREKRFLYSTLSVTILGAVLVFWCFNMFGSPERRTKLYMGDTGSMTLGLFLCVLIFSLCGFEGINGSLTNGKYLAISLSSLLIPIMEVPRLIVTRLISHKSPFQPDTNHIHHRLMRCGLTSRQSLAVILSMDVLIVVLTALMTRVFSLTLIFIIDVLLYTVAQLIIYRNIKTDTVPKELY